MLKSPYVATAFLAALLSTAGMSEAQDDTSQFTPENAILNTSIPFAIGAREARQELRGAFGWSTFQEGLVEGVYFRFDPDGYARFSPTPRLDTNVFEVICRPRTTSCMGRKATLSLYLTGDGSLQLQLEDFAPGDTLHLVEGVTNLPLPEQTLTDLDSRLETLLSSGGDLVVKRGDDTVSSTSLSGFGAVATYLRWITAQQDYTVLPRDWPVPSAEPLVAQPLTLAPTRQIAVTQPQSRPVFDAAEQRPGETSNNNSTSEVRVELSALRDLIATRNASENPEADVSVGESLQVDHELSAELLALSERVFALENAVLHMQRTHFAETNNSMSSSQADYEASMHNGNEKPSSPAQVSSNDPQRLAARLEYLITEIGLDAETALMLANRGSGEATEPTNHNVEYAPRTETIVSEILEELRDQLPMSANLNQMDTAQSANLEANSGQSGPQNQALNNSATGTSASNDYQVLTDYFSSVFDG